MPQISKPVVDADLRNRVFAALFDDFENKVFMKKNENFKGWDEWKEATKDGIDCFVLFERHGNKIITKTENLGIAIENTTTFHGEYDEVYVALTGDEVAITDIRIMK